MLVCVVCNVTTPEEALLPRGGMALARAVSTGNVAEVKKLLTDPTIRSTLNTPVDGTVVLMTAAMSGSSAMVELLLLAGADDRIAASSGGFLPLHFASAFGHTDAVNSLLELGNSKCVNVKDSTGSTPVLLAAAGGHVEVVSVLLNIGADVTLADKQGRMPIHVAATNGHLNIIRVMIQRFGLERCLGFLNKDDETVLLVAVKSKQIPIAAFILSSGAHWVPDDSDWHPVHIVAMSGSIELANEVMKSAPMKAAINIKSPGGTTPLFEACGAQQLEMVKLFLSLGADVTIADKEGRLPLHIAARVGAVEILKALMEKDKSKKTLNMKDKGGQTAIFTAACRAESAAALEYLVSIGGSLTVAASSGHSPLEAASALGQLPCVKVLFTALKSSSKGSSFMKSNQFIDCLNLTIMNERSDVVVYFYSMMMTMGDPKVGKELIHTTAALGKVSVMKALLQVPALRAQIDVLDEGLFTPLFKAVIKEQTDMALFLISQGANVKLRGPNNQMPIHTAAGFNLMDIVKELLKDPATRKVLINAQDKDDASPLLIASHNGHLAMVEYLLSMGADPCLPGQRIQLPIHWAAGKGHVDIVKALLKYDPQRRSLNARTKRGSTPLHNAVSLHRLEMVEYLLSIGASDRVRDEEGLLPIGTAALNDELEPAKILMKYDPKRETVNMRSTLDGTTPLYIAGVQGYVNFVRYLLSVGADPRIPDIRGQNTAQVAAKNGFVEVVKVLFQHVPHTAYPAESPVKEAKGIAVLKAKTSVIQVVNFETATVTEIDTKESPEELERMLRKMEMTQQAPTTKASCVDLETMLRKLETQRAPTTNSATSKKTATKVSAAGSAAAAAVAAEPSTECTPSAAPPEAATSSTPPTPTRMLVRSPMDVMKALAASESRRDRDLTPLQLAASY